jgi:hypothetical protein
VKDIAEARNAKKATCSKQMLSAALRGTTRKRRVAGDTAANVYVTDGNYNRVLKLVAASVPSPSMVCCTTSERNRLQSSEDRTHHVHRAIAL